MIPEKKAQELVNIYYSILSDLPVTNIKNISKQCAIKHCEGLKKENESMLEMAKLHMDERACLVLISRIKEIESVIESIKQLK